jgi:hypothetical protein
MKTKRSRPIRTPLRGALLAAFLAASSLPCPAAITYVGKANIPIPTSFGGVYLDLNSNTRTPGTGSGGTLGETDSYTVSFSQPGEWDVNFFFGGAAMVHSDTFNPYRAGDGTDHFSAIHNLGFGTVIDGGPASGSPPGGLPPGGSRPLLPGAPYHFGASGAYPADPYMGGLDFEFASGKPGYIGFVLDDGLGSSLYGWIFADLRSDGSEGEILAWAYSDQPILVGQTPEPSVTALAGIALAGFALRRRRAG